MKPDTKVTIKDVARAAGVSPSTVSRVFYGHRELLRPETCQKVLDEAGRLGYVPNLLASGLRGNQTRTMGAVVPDLSNSFFSTVAHGIQTEARKNGFEVFLCSADRNADQERDAIAALCSRRVDALIVATSTHNSTPFRDAIKSGQPLVLIDRLVPGLHCDSVVIDNRAATCEAVTKLIEMGHRRIGLITPPLLRLWPRCIRLEGYQAALSEAEIPFDPELFLELPIPPGTPTDAIHTLFARPQPPTALCVLNPSLGGLVFKTVRDMGLDIPRQLSLVLFDDPDWASLVTPAITAVRQPGFDLGARAASLAVARIRDRKRPFETVSLRPQLFERYSIGPATDRVEQTQCNSG